MYRIAFFTALIILSSCARKKDGEISPAVTDTSFLTKEESLPPREYSYNDTVSFPRDTESGSGYFKGLIPEKVKMPEIKEQSQLYQFLSKNLDQKEIKFLNDKTLSHSVFIDHKKSVRMDTLRNGNVTIISKYNFGEKESQLITINGIPVRKSKSGINYQDEMLDISASSFRDFTFKGREFYYMTAGIMDSWAGTACLIEYYLFYDVKNRKLSLFNSLRVDMHYFFGDINGDDQLDFLEIDNNNNSLSSFDDKNHFVITPYSCNVSGDFKILKDRKGKTYNIIGNTGMDYYVGDTINIENSHWPVKLK